MIAHEGFTRKPIEATFISSLAGATLSFGGQTFKIKTAKVIDSGKPTRKIGPGYKPKPLP